METLYKDLKDYISPEEICEKKHKSCLKTKIVAWYTDTGEEIFTKSNIVTIAGGAFLARSLFDLNTVEITPSYNTALNLDDTVISTTPSAPTKAYLFCVGMDGCGRENSQVYAEKYASWIDPVSGLVPLQYVNATSDLNAYEKKMYFGKRTMSDKIGYYFKKFDSDPVLVQQFTDGSPVDATVYNINTSLEAETIVTMQLSISKSDCRDYFISTTGINDARINCISICTGWPKEVNGITVYQDIRPVTRLNFPNESLIDTEKSITYSYSIYF